MTNRCAAGIVVSDLLTMLGPSAGVPDAIVTPASPPSINTPIVMVNNRRLIITPSSFWWVDVETSRSSSLLHVPIVSVK
jgi:hypothetical protein